MAEIDKVRLISSLKECNSELSELAFLVIHDMDLEIKTMKATVDKLEKSINEIENAFANGDIHGHRLYHERLIRNSFANESVKASVKTDLVQKAIYFTIAAVLAFVGIKIGIN